MCGDAQSPPPSPVDNGTGGKGKGALNLQAVAKRTTAAQFHPKRPQTPAMLICRHVAQECRPQLNWESCLINEN